MPRPLFYAVAQARGRIDVVTLLSGATAFKTRSAALDFVRTCFKVERGHALRFSPDRIMHGLIKQVHRQYVFPDGGGDPKVDVYLLTVDSLEEA